MVERFRANGKAGGRNQHTFEAGHKKGGGRTKGTGNVLPRVAKEAILDALEKWGRDAKGKDGLVGYFMKLIEEGKDDLICTLVGKILPLQVNSKVDGAVQIVSIPPEALKGASEEELTALETVMQRIAGSLASVKQDTPDEGEALAYAKVLGNA